jgi:hypothetical protein
MKVAPDLTFYLIDFPGFSEILYLFNWSHGPEVRFI